MRDFDEYSGGYDNEDFVERKALSSPKYEEPEPKDFLDMNMPSIIDFRETYYICGNTYRSVWAIVSYKTSTKRQALLRHIGEMDGVTLKIETRIVSGSEERRIIDYAAKKNRMNSNNTDNVQESITATSNLQDVTDMVANMHRNREPLFHVVAYIETMAPSEEELIRKRKDVETELSSEGIVWDKLILRQKEGFLSVFPGGKNQFGDQYERVFPASSVANLFPLNYSGKTDPHGFYIGKDRYGSNIIVDFGRRKEDKLNSNILILGNSGEGKSYLLKLILTNMRLSGLNVICLDPEHEYKELTEHLGGCFIDLMSGEYKINVLEPKQWDDGVKTAEDDGDFGETPGTFKKSSRLSQHISFLRDFFRTYKGFTIPQIDTIEIMLEKLYKNFGISDDTDFARLKKTDYPILSDLYELIEKEYKEYDGEKKNLYTERDLQEIALGLHSMCRGSEAVFFNGHTNITDSSFLVFGVKGLLQGSKNVKDAMLFNILSYMSNELLTRGRTVAGIDEFYLFLSNITAVEYIRNFSKRVRKKDSSVILASQNLEDFLIESVREYTKPLFSIPTHHFLFNPGPTDPSLYKETLQIEDSEFELIKYPHRGSCLYKCGNERYNLEVHAPDYKEQLFGSAGGR